MLGEVGRQRGVACFEAAVAAGFATRRSGIYDHDVLEALHRLHQCGGLAPVFDEGRIACRRAIVETGPDQRHGCATGAVVAAIGIADADDQEALAQPRSMSSFRKCVAQEMQGS